MKKIYTSILLFFLALVTLMIIPVYVKIGKEFNHLKSDDPRVWENVIREFEEKDHINPPAENAVLFVGSSSIRFWPNLQETFSQFPVIQRGFGGAKLKDIIYYADRIIYPYRPKIIVLFAGTNDISGRTNDKSPEKLFSEFRKLADSIDKKLPGTKLIFLPITPTTSRWEVWPMANQANDLIESYIMSKSDMFFIKTDQVFLNHDGLPKSDLLWWDGTHLNGKGYKKWEDQLNPLLDKLYFNTGNIFTMKNSPDKPD
jgi:lysophospholipase L1-like esterase